jgi:hypothetical protein
MMKGIKFAVLLTGLLFASSVQALPLPDFILYGAVTDGAKVSAYWYDHQIASTVSEAGVYKLAINMDTDNTYTRGAIVEIWINGEPTGQTVGIGSVGTAQKMDLD